MTGTSADYLQRTADVLLYDGDLALLRPAEADPALAEGSWQLTTGIQKLAQRFLIILLTPTGSPAHQPEFGTDFIPQARAGVWRTSADAALAFVSAATSAQQQVQQRELSTDPDDERIAGVILDDIQVSAGRVSVTMTLVSRAGTTRQYIVPIDVPVR